MTQQEQESNKYDKKIIINQEYNFLSNNMDKLSLTSTNSTQEGINNDPGGGPNCLTNWSQLIATSHIYTPRINI